MMDYNELIERLRTESLDSRKAALSIMDLCMDAASAIEALTAELDAAIVGHETLQKEMARVKAERDAAVECIDTIAEQFEKGACHDDYAEAAIAEWYAKEDKT